MKEAPKPEKKKGYYLPTILLGIIVAAIFLLAIFTYQVPATERALVLTMGKITKEAEPGLHLRLPLPFQQVIRYDIRKRPFDGNIGHLEETTTRDQKQVVIGLNVIYRIKDLKRFKEAAPERDLPDQGPETVQGSRAEARDRAGLPRRTYAHGEGCGRRQVRLRSAHQHRSRADEDRADARRNPRNDRARRDGEIRT